MSIAAIRWANRLPHALRANEHRVLIQLADYADARGRGARPSVPTMADTLKIDRRTVQRALRELQRVGAIRAVGVHEHGVMVYDLAVGDDPVDGQLVLAAGGGSSDAPGGGATDARHFAAGGASAAGGAAVAPPKPSLQEDRTDEGLRPSSFTQVSDQELFPENLTDENLDAFSGTDATDARANAPVNSIERARAIWPVASETERVLLKAAVDVALVHNGKVRPWRPEAVAELAHEFADRDVETEVGKWRDWHCPGGLGENKPVQNITASLRTWLKRAPSLATAIEARNQRRGLGSTAAGRAADQARELLAYADQLEAQGR